MSRPVLAALVLAACATEPAFEPTFTNVRTEVLAPSCAFSTCHGSGSGYLELDGVPEDFDALVDVDAFAAQGETLVVPGDADASYLVKKLRGDAGIVGDAMPPGGVELDAARLQLVIDWIDAGALDD